MAEWRRFLADLPAHHPLHEATLGGPDELRPGTGAGAAGVAAAVETTPRPAAVPHVPKAPPLVTACAAHLEWLSTTLAGRPHGVYLADRTGHLLRASVQHGAPDVEDSLHVALTSGRAAVRLAGPAGDGASSGSAAAASDFAGMAVPIRDESGETVGALALAVPQEHATPAQLTLLAYAARNAECELARVAATERSESLLVVTTELLGASLDAEAVLRRIAAAVVPALADTCTIYAYDAAGRPQRFACAHRDPAREQLLARFDGPASGEDEDDTSPLARLLRTGTPYLLTDTTGAVPPDHTLASRTHPLREALGVRSEIGVPIVAGGVIIGAVTFGHGESGRSFGAEDVDVAGEVALRAGMALEAARLHQHTAAARQRAERNARLIRRLLGVTTRLASAVTTTEVASIVVNDIVAAADAAAGSIALVEGTTIRPLRATGYPERLLSRFTRFGLDAPVPFADCVRTGEAVFVGSREEWARSYPHLLPSTEDTGHSAFAALPLRLDGAVTGAIGLSFTEPRSFDIEEREFHQTLARQCALAIERAGLYENLRRELRERARAEEVLRAGKAELRVANEHLAFLSETTARLLASDSPRTLLAGLARRLAELLDLEVYFNFLVTDDDAHRRLRLDSCAGVDPERARDFEWLEFGQAVCGTAAAEERRIIVEDVASSRAPMTALIRELGVQAYACHPLIARGRLIGTLSFGTRKRSRFRPEQLALLQAVADHVAVAMDRARAYAAEQDARRAAEDASLAKSQFLAVMSHELRTPLTAIIGYADLLGTTAPAALDEVTAGFIQRMRTSSWHLRDVINQILDLSRIEAGKEEITLRPVAIAELVHAAAALVQPQAQRRGLALDVHLPEPPPVIITDAGKLRQILVNLLSNAVKFTERGGIRVVVERDAAGPLCFRVIDSGVGIAPEHLDRIWDPFTQVDQSSTRSVGGSGLGLSVSRRLSALLEGELTVHSQPGAGSTFTMRLSRPEYVDPNADD